MVKVEINLTNKWLYSLIVVGIVFVLGIGVYAYNSGLSPSVMGHSAEEIMVQNSSGDLVTLQSFVDSLGSGEDNIGIGSCRIETTDLYPSSPSSFVKCDDDEYLVESYCLDNVGWYYEMGHLATSIDVRPPIGNTNLLGMGVQCDVQTNLARAICCK